MMEEFEFAVVSPVMDTLLIAFQVKDAGILLVKVRFVFC
jgi:hypothetical protein